MWVTDCSTLSVTVVQSAGEGGGGDENRTASFVQLSETRRQACWKSGNGGRRAFWSDSNKVSTGRERWHVMLSSTHEAIRCIGYLVHTGPAAEVVSETLLEFVEVSGGLDPAERAHGYAFFLLSASSSLHHSLFPAWSPLESRTAVV